MQRNHSSPSLRSSRLLCRLPRIFTASIFASITLCLLISPVKSEEKSQEQSVPNIVFILIDDMGYGDLSCYGNTAFETPNIDRLARRGIKFTQFYVNAPICSPARVGITTGQYPARHKINSYLNNRAKNGRRGMVDFLDPKAPAVAREFKKAGYATAHFGKWHQGGGRDVDDAPHPQAYGFDESLVSFEGLGDRILPPGGLSQQSAKLKQGKISHVPKHKQTEIYVDRTIGFIERHRREPFYVHLWLNDVHDGHDPRPDVLVKFKNASDNPFERKFFAVMDEMDRQLGRLFDRIEQLNLSKKTLIVLASDNGPTAWARYSKAGFDPPGSTGGLRGRKWSLYEGGIREPLIVCWKGTVPAGKTDDTSVLAGTDLFPSFRAIAGIDVSDIAFDGQDMSRALLGAPTKRQRPIFWEYGRDDSYLKPAAENDRSPNCAMREGNWKLLVNADGTCRELYDLATDAKESTNLAKKHPDVAKRLADKLLEWRHSLP